MHKPFDVAVTTLVEGHVFLRSDAAVPRGKDLDLQGFWDLLCARTEHKKWQPNFAW